MWGPRRLLRCSPCIRRTCITPRYATDIIWALIAPDCLLSPGSLAKICSIFIFPNYQFVWRHLSGWAVEKLQLPVHIANSRRSLGSTTLLLRVVILPNTARWLGWNVQKYLCFASLIILSVPTFLRVKQRYAVKSRWLKVIWWLEDYILDFILSFAFYLIFKLYLQLSTVCMQYRHHILNWADSYLMETKVLK